MKFLLELLVLASANISYGADAPPVELEPTFCKTDLSVRDARFSEDGKQITVITKEKIPRQSRAVVLDSATGEIKRDIEIGFGVAKAISKNGKFVAVAENTLSVTDYSNFRVYDLGQGKMVNGGRASPWPTTLSISDDGMTLLFGLAKGASIVAAESGQVIKRLPTDFAVKSSDFIDSEKARLAGTWMVGSKMKRSDFRETVVVWELAKDRHSLKILPDIGYYSYFPELAYDKNGNPLLRGEDSNPVPILYDLQTGNPIASFGSKTPGKSFRPPFAISSNGLVASNTIEREIASLEVWDSKQKRFSMMTSEPYLIHPLEFSSDGNLLMAGIGSRLCVFAIPRD